MEYCGIDVHQKYSEICILAEDGEVMETSRVQTIAKCPRTVFLQKEPMKVVLEAGGSSPWVSRLIEVSRTRNGRVFPASGPTDRGKHAQKRHIDAEVLARLVRLDPGFLGRSSTVARKLSCCDPT